MTDYEITSENTRGNKYRLLPPFESVRELTVFLVADAETYVEAKLETLFRNVPKLTKACGDVNKEFRKFSEQGECRLL